MLVAILIVAVILIALATVFLLANRQRAATGNLSRETVAATRAHPLPVDRRAGEHRARGERGGTRPRRRSARRRSRRRARQRRRGGKVTVWEPVDEEELGVTRRQFLNRGILVTVLAGLGTFGASLLAFLWPSSTGGFGGTIAAGKLATSSSFMDDEQAAVLRARGAHLHPAVPEGRRSRRRRRSTHDFIYAGMEQGIVALYQKCVHLGCRVPWCQSAQWFECPCHGSKYNRVGEKRDGPAPRGLDRFQAIVSGGSVTINTGLLAVGPPIGTDTTGQVAEGPHCVG